MKCQEDLLLLLDGILVQSKLFLTISLSFSENLFFNPFTLQGGDKKEQIRAEHYRPVI